MALFYSPYKTMGGNQSSSFGRPRIPIPTTSAASYGSSNGLQGWEARRQGLIDTAFERYGANNFAAGGQYGPNNIMAFYQSQMGPVPNYQAPNAMAGMPYAQATQDLAARASAISMGSAVGSAQGNRALNPAALGGLYGQLVQQGASATAGAGLSGYQLGMGIQENAANQNFAAMMQDRMSRANALSDSLSRTYNYGMAGASALQNSVMDYWQQRYAAQQARQGMWGSLAGRALGVGAALATSGGSGTGAGSAGQTPDPAWYANA